MEHVIIQINIDVSDISNTRIPRIRFAHVIYTDRKIKLKVKNTKKKKKNKRKQTKIIILFYVV